MLFSGCFGPFWSIRGCFGALRPVIGCYKTFRVLTDHSGAFQNRLDRFRAFLIVLE